MENLTDSQKASLDLSRDTRISSNPVQKNDQVPKRGVEVVDVKAIEKNRRVDKFGLPINPNNNVNYTKM